MPTVTIDKHLKIPERRIGAPCKYPWAVLRIGDSFYAEVKASSLSTSARNATYKTGYKFKVRIEGKGSRVWRVA